MKQLHTSSAMLLATGAFIINIQGTDALVTGNIKIVGEGVSQFLPGSYVNTFPRWTAESTEEKSITLSRLVGSGLDRSNPSSTIAQQFVDPTSNEELWWPSDLEKLQVRPTLDFLIKSATPAYVLAGLEVRVPSDASNDGSAWKNFGLNCQPLASQWTSFNIAVEKGFRIETFYGRTLMKSEAEKDTIEWKQLSNGKKDEESCKEEEVAMLEKENQKMEAQRQTQNAMGILGALLAGTDENSPLAEGMHIVSIPICEDWTDLPPVAGANDTYKLVSVGTVESDARELLYLDDDLLALSATSVLSVDVSRIAPGKESEYIPDVYSPLYK